MHAPDLEMPKAVKDRLTFIKSFDTGGSAAKTFVVKDRGSQSMILKYADWEGIGDNGVPWLEVQTDKLLELNKILPVEASSWLPAVYEQGHCGDAFYVLLEYFEGAHPLSEYYIGYEGELIEPYLADIDRIAGFFGKYLYPLGSRKTPDNYIKSVGFDRISYRLGLFSDRNSETYRRYIYGKDFSIGGFHQKSMSKFFDELFRQKLVVINGKSYKSALNLLSSINSSKSTSALLAPEIIPKYTHGDANLRNFLRTKNGDLKIIDLRGSKKSSKTPAVCIPYDMGKMLHTVWVDIIRSGNFEIKAEETANGFEFNVAINRIAKNIKGLLKVRERMPALLKNNESLGIYLDKEPDWYEKALFAEACHILADTVNRLEQDRSGRHSLSYYLVGTMLLNDLIVKLA